MAGKAKRTRQVARKVAEAPKKAAQALLTPVQDFIKTESSSGIVLIAAAVIAFAWANSPWSQSYLDLLQVPVGVEFGAWGLKKALILWVNDLLMAMFFFLVGLEIKREVLIGELAGWQRASLPAVGAVGGMVVPALIYAAFHLGEPTIRGWGVPMATDIAFALGVLALLGDRVPLALKVFLLALAIVDDLGAVLVIAVFYTADLQLGSLATSLVAWGVALAYGRRGGAKPLVFAVIGLVCWYFMLKSGVHATIAGVLMALAVPLRHKVSMEQLRGDLRPLLSQGGGFEEAEVAMEHLEAAVEKAQSPLHSMEHGLAPYVAFGIMPIFAFFNAGVPLAAMMGSEAGVVGLVSIGVFLGLLIGKPLGVVGLVWLAVKAGITRLPAGGRWSGMLGVGLLAGIGFTMSLFIANLAFVGQDAVLNQAKVGVLAASVAAALAGLAFLTRALPKAAEGEARAAAA